MQQVIKQLQVHIASKVCELRQQPGWWSKARFLLVSAALSPATLLPSHPHRITDVPAPVSGHGATLQNSTPGRLIFRPVETNFETYLIRLTLRRMLSSPLRSAWSV